MRMTSDLARSVRVSDERSEVGAGGDLPEVCVAYWIEAPQRMETAHAEERRPSSLAWLRGTAWLVVAGAPWGLSGGVRHLAALPLAAV
jgi:hypothetical protein